MDFAGCFRLHRIHEVRDSYLGDQPLSELRWERYSTGVLTFALYTSPDAWYNVEAVIQRQALVGVGASSGGIADSIDWPDDYVVGRRIGPANAAN